MFSGIIEGTGRLKALKRVVKDGDGARVIVECPFSLSAVKKGDSIAVNGCCLTVVSKKGKTFEADLSRETLQVTNLGRLRPGDPVNLERSMRLGDRVGGHLVQGHVDGVGKIVSIKQAPKTITIVIRYPQELRRYLINKGSIAVDGISMTVNRLTKSTFALYVIPHTFQVTNFRGRKIGDPVNLETDMVGKYVASQRARAR